MKWLLTFNIYLAAAGALLAADPPMQPMKSLPYPNPVPGMATMSTAPTVPQPVLTGASGWNSDHSNPGCGAGASPAKGGGSAFARICEWLSFRSCPPVHSMCVPQPPRAPLRSFFHNSACGVGCANATDCGKGGCGMGGRNCGGGQDSVNIPQPTRMCASARCGGSPVWGQNAGGSCSSGVMGRMLSCFGLSGGSCGGKSSCGGLGGCSSCQYSKVPMSDIGQYQDFTTTQSVGRIAGLSSVGAAPAGSHFANPYKAPNAELQYRVPAAEILPLQPMSQAVPAPTPMPMQQTGTNPFPGPQGTLPYSKPFTNP